jgi:DNA-binding LacI/PurR family transcriptional regulator/GAF domain-containing protein
MSENERRRYGGRQDARPTIGVLISHPTHKNDYSMWLGVVDAARKRDVNVICFMGLCLHSPNGFEAQANVIYDLVSAEKLDGLVIMAGTIGQFVWPEERRAFIERYHPLPIVTLESDVAGIHNIYVDSFQNMRKAVLHLIQVHNYRRIAFIRGPENQREANERYRAYVETLAEYGLPLDPALVTLPLKWLDGRQGLAWLLDQQVDFEAVIGANDDLAFGAIEELRARGIQVPEKVAVVGYDDATQSRWITPPLTTVPIETYKWGQQALEMVLALIEGKPVPEQVVIPTELVVRQSCGCIDPVVVQAAVEPAVFLPEGSNERMSLETVVLGQREDILGKIRQTVGEQVLSIEPGQIARLWDAFTAELNNMTSGVFLRTLNQILRQTIATSGEIEGWDQVVSVLRRQALPCLRDSEELLRAENLWQQARVLIGKTAQRMQGYRQILSEQRMNVLREIGAELVTTFDTQSLMDVLARQLPRLDIPSAYLALYKDPQQPTGPAKLLLAYNEQGRIEIQAGGQVFPSLQLVPAGSLPQERPYSLIVEPLYFHEDQLGFALFEMGPQDGSVYEALRGEISSALKGALLVQQVERRALQLQTAAEVSRATSSILNLDELLPQAVELICDRFNLYYVGLFLVDETGQWAILHAGTGEAGQKMLKAGHKLEVGGSSMVGWCMANSQARIALDVGEEAVRFDNPLLPETHSEMALPLVSRGMAIGALTIQSQREAAFSQEDISALQTMASQVANAIENVRLFEQSRVALAEMEATQRRYIERAWTEYRRVIATSGYRQTGAERMPLGKEVLPEVQQAMAEQHPLVWHGDGDGGTDSALLLVPIMLRGQPIGAIGFRAEGEKQEWSAEDINLVETISEQLALAAENLRLIDETQRRAAREELTREITDKMRRATNVEEIVQTAVDELFSTLRTTRTFVRLGTAPSERGDGNAGT